MRELLDATPGARLMGDDYRADFRRAFREVGEPGLWKLERRQDFQERGNASWSDLVAGDWDESLRRLEEDRPALESYFRDIADRGISTWRVRVVESPITPYVQWELHALRIRVDCGENIRVVSPVQVKESESDHILPELVTLGADAMYEVIYSEDGLLEGGVRYTVPELVAQCQRFISDLYRSGEEFESFFAREVAPLGPPRRA